MLQRYREWRANEFIGWHLENAEYPWPLDMFPPPYDEAVEQYGAMLAARDYLRTASVFTSFKKALREGFMIAKDNPSYQPREETEADRAFYSAMFDGTAVRAHFANIKEGVES